MKTDSCMICAAQMQPFMRKRFDERAIRDVSYVRCKGCGFVWAKTIAELPEDEWTEVNHSFHAGYQGQNRDPNDPNWLNRLEAQASAIAALSTAGLIPKKKPWLDYGAGDGKLSRLLGRYSLPALLNYEPFMKCPGYVEEKAICAGAYSFVISTSLFEHLRERSQLDQIANLVSEDGVMGLHTVVVEEVPADPSWFYFLPVHCSFFTNESMRRLFLEWGFKHSVYQPLSRLWFWFKSDHSNLESAISELNEKQLHASALYHYKSGFVDFWKLNQAEVSRRRSLELS